jgi:hypothetical protein
LFQLQTLHNLVFVSLLMVHNLLYRYIYMPIKLPSYLRAYACLLCGITTSTLQYLTVYRTAHVCTLCTVTKAVSNSFLSLSRDQRNILLLSAATIICNEILEISVWPTLASSRNQTRNKDQQSAENATTS